MKRYEIAVVHGDGIGAEVCRPTVDVIRHALPDAGRLDFVEYPAGADHYRRTGDAFPTESLEGCRRADAVLHGAAGLPGVTFPDGTEAGVEFGLKLRVSLDLYANVRAIRLRPGVVSPLRGVEAGGIDYLIVREGSEGLYASNGAGAVVRDEVAVDMQVITRKGAERVCRTAFELARDSGGALADGRRRVTCCDKSNVLRSFGLFRRVFNEVAADFPDVAPDYSYADAMTVHLIQRPRFYNVIVAENFLGDILSDLGAATVGGMGMSPSAELGAGHGFFQAAHGSAPDIAGRNVANPYGTILSGAWMLRWLGERHGDGMLQAAGRRIDAAVDAALQSGVRTRDIGGNAATTEAAQAVIAALG